MIARAVLALVVGVGLTACGEGASLPRIIDAGSPVSSAGIEVLVPETWESRTDAGGLFIAADASDLTGFVTAGPRLWAMRVPVERPEPRELLDQAKTAAASISAPPEQVTVDGEAGVAIESSGDVVSRSISVDVDGVAYLVTIEAPAAQWESERDLLEQILESLRFV